MRTANNTFTVETLVAKYRNFVKEHASYEIVGADNEWGFPGSVEYGTDGWADHQLLIKLYIDVAGDEADQSILDKLSKYGELFWNNILTAEEYSFLRNNFKDTVAHIFSEGIQYGSDASLNSIHLGNNRNSIFISKAVGLIEAESGSCVYIVDDTFGDVAVLFPQSVILCEDQGEESALKKIRLYASGIKYRNIDRIRNEKVDIFIGDSAVFDESLAEDIYNTVLVRGGAMIICVNLLTLASMEKDAVSFRKQLVYDKSLKSVIKYEDDYNIIQWYQIIEKKEHSEVTFQELDKITLKVDYDLISEKIFLPGYYQVERPMNGIPLSNLLDYYDYTDEKKQIISVGQPIIYPERLGSSFKDVEIDSMMFNKGTNKFVDSENSGLFDYNVDFPSILLYGGNNNISAGIVSKCEVPYAVSDTIACFTAKDGIDLQYVASLLFEPIVAKQISAIYLEFYRAGMMFLMPVFLQNIMVPFHSPDERSKYLANAYYNALCSSKAELKRESELYRTSIRMRKHALTQSLSSIEAMFYALNEYRIRQKGELSDSGIISRVKGTTVKDAFEFLSEKLKMMMPVLEHIADVEYSFGKSEWINPESFVENYIVTNEKGWLNFKPFVTWESGNNLAMRNFYNDKEGSIVIAKGEPLNKFLFPKNALTKVFDNIVSNARAWGFNDDNRKDYQLRFSWHIADASLIVEIANNGTPIPADRDVTSLLEYGVSTSLHSDGHNGIGCNEIDDIMHRYDGKVEIVSTPEDEFTVKYILTFNNVSTFRPNKAK